MSDHMASTFGEELPGQVGDPLQLLDDAVLLGMVILALTANMLAILAAVCGCLKLPHRKKQIPAYSVLGRAIFYFKALSIVAIIGSTLTGLSAVAIDLGRSAGTPLYSQYRICFVAGIGLCLAFIFAFTKLLDSLCTKKAGKAEVNTIIRLLFIAHAGVQVLAAYFLSLAMGMTYYPGEVGLRVLAGFMVGGLCYFVVTLVEDLCFEVRLAQMMMHCKAYEQRKSWAVDKQMMKLKDEEAGID